MGLPFVIVYLDDILVASPDLASHEAHLEAVLQRLRDNGLVLNLPKCSFFRQSMDILGLRITAEGAAPLPSQVAAIQDFPSATTIKEL